MFKPGDKVKVKNYEDINVDAIAGFGSLSYFHKGMKEHCGKIFTIDFEIIKGEFFLKECNYAWNKQWLELYNDKFEQHKRRLLSV